MSDDQRHMPHTITGLSVSDAAAHLGLSANAVRHKIRRGTLTAYKVNGEWRVTVEMPDQPTPRHMPVDSPQPTPWLTPEHTPPDSPDYPESGIVSAQHQVEVLRDSLVAPLVALTKEQQERIAEQAETIGRIAAEVEHERRRASMAETACDIAQQHQKNLEAERDALRSRVSDLEQRSAELVQPTGTTSQERSQRPEKPRQRRWWLRLFGIDE